MLLVQGRGKVAFIPAVTAILLHQCAMDRGIECVVVSTGLSCNRGYSCSY